MYIDENIIISDDEVPPMLREDFKALKAFYDKGDWHGFDNYFEGVEASTKEFQIDGVISKELQTRIFHKYGLYY